MEQIIDFTELNFNVNSISFSTPKPSGAGGKSVGIYCNKGIFRLSLPEMIQWGAADFKDEKTGKGNDKFEFTLQFPTEGYKNEETKIALANMMALEAKLLEAGQQNSKQWFGKVYPAEVLSALWSPMLKYPKNKSTGEPDLTAAPGLRVKLPKWDGQWKSEIYNEDAEKLFPDPSNELLTPVDFLPKSVKATCLLQCGGLWFANGKFGVTWKLIQAVVPKPKSSLMGTCFLKKKAPAAQEKEEPEPVSRQQSAVAATLVEDSDEEDGDGDGEGGEGDDQEKVVETVVAAVETVQEPVSIPVVIAEETGKKKATKKK
jgi:hypothetical protein